jgi:hypothetical protein
LIHVFVNSFIRTDPSTCRAIAEAIEANEDSALSDITGVNLSEYYAVLGLREGPSNTNNGSILSELRKVQRARRVKSAMGGVR